MVDSDQPAATRKKQDKQLKVQGGTKTDHWPPRVK